MYQFKEMTNIEKQLIEWQYAAPYEIYNLSIKDFETEDSFFTAYHYDEIAGMIKLHYNEGSHFLGLAMHPSLTGKGMGQTFVESALSFLEKRDIKRIQLVVATRNERAIKVYERCGFEEIDYELMLAGNVLEEFVKMEYRKK